MNELNENLAKQASGKDIVSSESTGINSSDATLRISGSTATCQGVLELKSNYTASCTMTLQRKKSGEWTKVTSWSSSGSIVKYTSVTSGKTYRVRFHGSVKNSKGTTVDTFTAYSKTVTA